MGESLPNLLVIGAAKAGTTSLHRYLDDHPEVSMSAIKEPNVLEADDYRSRASAYKGLFDSEAPVRGESSTNYSKHPRIKGVPARVEALIPDAKLIYLVRDPIDRAVAHWIHNVAAGREQRPLRQALNCTDEQNVYICASRFATQLDQYLARFPIKQLMVLDQTNLLHHRAETLRAVFRFLGVAPDHWSPNYDRRFNLSDEQRRPSAIGERFRRSKPSLALRARAPRAARMVSRLARHALSTKVQPPRLDSRTRSRLAELFASEVTRLRALTGEPFSHWSV